MQCCVSVYSDLTLVTSVGLDFIGIQIDTSCSFLSLGEFLANYCCLEFSKVFISLRLPGVHVKKTKKTKKISSLTTKEIIKILKKGLDIHIFLLVYVHVSKIIKKTPYFHNI